MALLLAWVRHSRKENGLNLAGSGRSGSRAWIAEADLRSAKAYVVNRPKRAIQRSQNLGKRNPIGNSPS